MRIFAAGIACETNTFSPFPTAIEDFIVQRRADVLEDARGRPCPDLIGVWRDKALERGDDYRFGLMAWAPPAGVTTRSAYESLRDEMLADLQAAMPVDIVLLMLHGAMVAQGYEDCEEDIVRRVRAVTGPSAVIGVEFDLHCHLSESKIALADIVIALKEYPHVDSNDRARELFDLAVAIHEQRIWPTMELFDCRMMGLYPTSRQPLRGFVDSLIAAEQRSDVLSMSLGHGFPFGDVPHGGAKMLVVTNDDRSLAQRLAREYGLEAHRLRREIGFDALSLPMEEALSRALKAAAMPVVVADQSDNTGGGAPGDATYALRWLLDHNAEHVAMAILYDPEVVKITRKAGVGATLPVRLGGKLSVASGDPIDIEVTVLATRTDYSQALPQRSGAPIQFPAGNVVALRHGTIDIVVGSESCQCMSPTIFSDLGIDPTRKRVLIPKSAQHFYDAFSRIASEVIYMAAPGAVAPDPRRIAYRRLSTRNLYPWIESPELT